MNLVKLLPCPFCNGDAEFQRLGDRRQSCIVACTNCGARHESPDQDEFNGSSWNRRFGPKAEGPPETAETDLQIIHRQQTDFLTKVYYISKYSFAAVILMALLCGIQAGFWMWLSFWIQRNFTR